MTTTLAVNENNDLFIGVEGSLALRTGLPGVMQAAEHAAKTQLGEMIYAVDEGLPNFATVWNGSPNTAQFEAFLRRALMSVEGVVEVSQLTITLAGQVLQYRATIKTIYGTGVLNG